jgi:hypothetical protein
MTRTQVSTKPITPASTPVGRRTAPGRNPRQRIQTPHTTAAVGMTKPITVSTQCPAVTFGRLAGCASVASEETQPMSSAASALQLSRLAYDRVDLGLDEPLGVDKARDLNHRVDRR